MNLTGNDRQGYQSPRRVASLCLSAACQLVPAQVLLHSSVRIKGPSDVTATECSK